MGRTYVPEQHGDYESHYSGYDHQPNRETCQWKENREKSIDPYHCHGMNLWV